MRQAGEQAAPLEILAGFDDEGAARAPGSGLLMTDKEWRCVSLQDHAALRDDDDYVRSGDIHPSEATQPIRQDGAPPVHERQEWGSSMDYLFVLLGYAIGIGNVWRFPYLVGKHGGGAFLVPYLVCLCTVACPLFILELCLGQATRCSTIECFRRIHPMWLGVAVASTLMVLFVCTYYNMLLAYCVIYLLASLKDPLPWSEEAYAQRGIVLVNTSASEDYWENTVLRRFTLAELDDTNSAGAMQWHLVASLAVIWIVIFLVLSNGIHSTSKAAYITVPLPIILMTVMFFRAVTLPGAGDGISHYTRFDASEVFSLEVWAAACGQILFSLSPGMGTAITMSSYTSPGENVYRTGLKIAVANSTFSIFSGFVIFALLGNMAQNRPGGVAALAESSGAGLAFVALAEGISRFESGANVFSVCFFAMLLMLGLDSTFAWVETVNAVIDDFCHHRVRETADHRILPFSFVKPGWIPTKINIAAATASVLFLCTLPYCTRVGYYLLDVVDHFVPTYILLLTCFVECIMVGVHYGYGRVSRHIAVSTGKPLPRYFVWCWKFIAPCMCLALLISIFVSDSRKAYESYPSRINAVGICFTAICVACMAGVPLQRMVVNCKTHGRCTPA
eukprot:Rhum_TRINITY_DN22965_c0_g1::Rhum_TRINITY_DN22965_c0_g1_i1::g.176647::m.176647